MLLFRRRALAKERRRSRAAREDLEARMARKEWELETETTRRNDLITYLAHDLKTPLTSVIGYLSLLAEAPDMPQEQRAK